MTPLDRLIALAAVQGTLDLRCQLHGSWHLDHPQLPASEAAYHIVLSGECRLSLSDGRHLPLREGQLLLLPHGASHILSHGEGTPGRPQQDRFGALPRVRIGRGTNGLDMFCGHFHHAPGSALFDALPEVLLLPIQANSSLAALVELLRQEAESARQGARSLIDHLSGALFTLILRTHLEQQPVLSGALALLTDRRLARAWQAMLDDPARPWSVSELAALANQSRATFARNFAALAGTSPGAMLTRLRMEKARLLLRTSTLSLNAVALEVGYESPAAFSRAFRQCHGDAPGRYRQAGRAVD
ncbi:AraC family transcriptional regulator [Pseudomonas sp. F(2018)]|uniref:cupin domain-containing protein n=1 Tax=Pseudomonas sp. F(2018) TaxID=2502240 RepID=UPI0010F4D332|nr:AraC family transcriptional regulator [Pseudomonas sp. F(2018)]